MATKKLYPCMTCDRRYAEIEEAEVCERQHMEGTPKIRVTPLATLGWCAFCNQTTDPCGCVDGRKLPQVLSPSTLLKLGALTIEVEKSEGLEKHLDDQRIAYEEALARYGPQGLITALLERDRMLLEQGRTIADGRMLSKLTRELVRAALYSQGGRPDVAAVERALQAFGSEPADLRQLALHGSTLGPLESPEKVAEQLASGERKQR